MDGYPANTLLLREELGRLPLWGGSHHLLILPSATLSFRWEAQSDAAESSQNLRLPLLTTYSGSSSNPQLTQPCDPFLWVQFSDEDTNCTFIFYFGGLPSGSWWRICLPMQETQETQFWSLGREDPLAEEMATHSSILAWKIPWTEEPGRLQSMESQRIRHDWACTETGMCIYLFILAEPHSMWDLSSLIRDWSWPPALEVWSLNHRTAREVPNLFLLSPLSYS